jgi:hypothetical protein
LPFKFFASSTTNLSATAWSLDGGHRLFDVGFDASDIVAALGLDSNIANVWVVSFSWRIFVRACVPRFLPLPPPAVLEQRSRCPVPKMFFFLQGI